MNGTAHQPHSERGWLKILCRLLPVATAVGAMAAVTLGFPFPVLSVAGLLLICIGICAVLWLQSKDTERQIDVAVEEHRRITFR